MTFIDRNRPRRRERRRGARAGRLVARSLLWLLPLAPSPSLLALSTIPPADLGELARSCEAVVLARCAFVRSEGRGALIFRRVTLEVERALSGPLAVGERFDVELPGGRIGERFWEVPGAPRLEPGESYLLFLRQKEGDPATWLPAVLGSSTLREGAAPDGTPLFSALEPAPRLSLPRPDGATPEPVGSFERDALLLHLGDVLEGSARWDAAAAGEVAPEAIRLDGEGGGGAAPAGCVFMENGGRRFRWQAFQGGGRATIRAAESGDPSIAGGGFREVEEAVETWLAIPGTSLDLVYGGPASVPSGCSSGNGAQDGVVVFDDPCSAMPALQGCGGTLAFGGPLGSGTHTFDGASWWTVTSWIVVVNDGAGCVGSSNYRILLAHELGHGLGFGHVGDPSALMHANCCHDPSSLDRACARFLYPPTSPGNARAVVDAGTDLAATVAGDRLWLSGSARDDGRPASPGRLSLRWSKIGGPGSVSFDDARSAETGVAFSRSGRYLLRLTADDGDLLASDAIEVEVTIFAGATRSASFQARVGGYAGTVDAQLQESRPGADGSRLPELSVDADDPGGSGLEAQVLLRFEDLFGDGARQVPPGASVVHAALELAGTNPGDGARLHRMTEPWEESAGWRDFAGGGVRAGRDALSRADATAAGSVGTSRIDVTASLAAWSRDPCSNHGWVFLPRGGDGWDFSSAEGAEPPRLEVTWREGSDGSLIAPGATWRFWRGSRSPPAGWISRGFDDSGWESGPASIGYGDGDDATRLADMRGRYLTLFARRRFEVAGPAPAGGDLLLTLVVDDGAAAWLDGVEIGRVNLPSGTITATTRARSSGETRVARFEIPAPSAAPGPHVLAVSVHNSALTSSDLSFDASLGPAPPPARPVACGGPRFRRGDANDDGGSDLSDAVRILAWLFSGAPRPACPDAADVDDDGRVTIPDAIRLLGWIFLSGQEPPVPGGSCGVDPSEDALPACEGTSCGL